MSVQVRGSDPESSQVDAAVAQLFSDLRNVDDVFSTWKSGSQVSCIQRGELTLADADHQVQEVAALCDQAERDTGGYFTPHWRDGRTSWDPTGLVKGWAAQRALVRLAQALPEHDVIFNAAGDVGVWCNRADTPDWTIGIEDYRPNSGAGGDAGRRADVPLATNSAPATAIVGHVAARQLSVATSGSAARGGHIRDPHTATSATGLLAVTVLGPSLLWADVWATAAYARGSDAEAWLKAQSEASGGATLSGYSWVITHLDGSVTSSGKS